MRLTKKFSTGLAAALVLSAALAVYSNSVSAQSPGLTDVGAVPLCEAGGNITHDLNEGSRGDQYWLSVELPPDSHLTADIVHHKDDFADLRFPWRFEVSAWEREDDGSRGTRQTLRDSTAPRDWRDLAFSNSGDPVGDFITDQNRGYVLAGSLDGGEYLISATHTLYNSGPDGAEWRIENFAVVLADGTEVDPCTQSEDYELLLEQETYPVGETFHEAVPLCEAGGRLIFEVAAAETGDERWVELYLPPNSSLTVDVTNTKNVNRAGNWNVEVIGYPRDDDGSPGQRNASSVGDGEIHGRLTDTAPFWWGTSSPFISQAELGDDIAHQNRPLITTRTGGFFLVEAEHGFEHGNGDPTARWRVDDFTVVLENGDRVDACGFPSADGLENESGEPLQPLPVPVGVDFSDAGFYDDRGRFNDPAFPICTVSSEYRQGPCFETEEDAVAYLEGQVGAGSGHGHVWVGGFDEPLVAQ